MDDLNHDIKLLPDKNITLFYSQSKHWNEPLIDQDLRQQSFFRQCNIYRLKQAVPFENKYNGGTIVVHKSYCNTLVKKIRKKKKKKVITDARK